MGWGFEYLWGTPNTILDLDKQGLCYDNGRGCITQQYNDTAKTDWVKGFYRL